MSIKIFLTLAGFSNGAYPTFKICISDGMNIVFLCLCFTGLGEGKDTKRIYKGASASSLSYDRAMTKGPSLPRSH